MILLLLILPVKRQQLNFYSEQLLQRLYRFLRQDFSRTLVTLCCFCAKPKLRQPLKLNCCFSFLCPTLPLNDQSFGSNCDIKYK